MFDGAVRAGGHSFVVGGLPAVHGITHPEVAAFGGERQQQLSTI